MILFFVILALSLFMFGSNLQSTFSIIDDHNIIKWLGDDNNFSADDFFSFLKNSQDFQIGNYGRFRPSLEVSKVIEMYLFDDNVLYYQLTRLSVFVLISFIFSLFIIQRVGVLYGSIIFLILFSESAWRDIFNRLITSEIYTFYGLVIFIPVSIIIFNAIKNKTEYKSKIKQLMLIILYLVFGLISIGCKENFTFLIVIPMAILFSSYKLSNDIYFYKFINYVSVVLIGYGFFILVVIVNYFLNTNDDITGFGFSSNGGTLLKITKNFAEIFFIKWMGLILLIPLLLMIFGKNLHNYNDIKKWTLQLYLSMLFLSLLLLFQVVYYSGTLPTGNRYDFPIIFFHSLFLVLIVIFAKKVLPVFINNKKYLRVIILIPLILILIIKNPINEINKTSEASYAHKERTKQFQFVIDKIVYLANTQSTSAILVNTYNVWDYELISSFYKFIRYRGIKNPIYLKLHYKTSNYTSSVEKMFVKRLDYVSNGVGLINKLDWTLYDVMDWGFSSLADFKKKQPECLAVNIINNVNIDIIKKHTISCATSIVFKYRGP